MPGTWNLEPETWDGSRVSAEIVDKITKNNGMQYELNALLLWMTQLNM